MSRPTAAKVPTHPAPTIIYAEDVGLTPRKIRRQYPHATEFADDNGRPYWLTADLIDPEATDDDNV